MKFKAIMRLNEKGAPSKIKDLTKETISKGKAIKLNKFIDITDKDMVSDGCTLSNSIVTYYSYIFYPSKILDILHSNEQDD